MPKSGSGFLDRGGGRGGGCGRRTRHAFDHIAGLGGFGLLEDRFGGDLDDHHENRRAENGTDDLVPLPGIHMVTLR